MREVLRANTYKLLQVAPAIMLVRNPVVLACCLTSANADSRLWLLVMGFGEMAKRAIGTKHSIINKIIIFCVFGFLPQAPTKI